MKSIREDIRQRTPLRVPGVAPGTYWLEERALVTVGRPPAEGEDTSELISSPQNGWMLSERAVEVAFIMEAMKIRVQDESTGALYECDIEYFFRHSTLVKQGYERFRRLPLARWTKGHSEVSGDFQQQSLAAGGVA
jgi:hypothetical protein